MGCMAQRVKDEIVRRAPHVDLVLGTSNFRSAVQDLADLFDAGGRVVRTAKRPDPEFLPGRRPQRDGASGRVPRVRDRHARLQPQLHLLHRAAHARQGGLASARRAARRVPRASSDDGVREVTFLGQNINTYGQDLHPQRKHTGEICTLLERAAEIEGLDRIRFLTSNPFDMTEDMMRRFGQVPKVMPWLHIPAQSGSDAVLARMQRTYTVEQYHEVVGWARKHIPGVEITSDFIVGFSGETEEEFDATASQLVRGRSVSCRPTCSSTACVRRRSRPAAYEDDVPEDVKKPPQRRAAGRTQDTLVATERNQEPRSARRVRDPRRGHQQERSHDA